MGRSVQLSDLQLAVVRVLWELEEATVAQVHERLHASRGLASTTVATLLSRLEKRGVVARRTDKRQFVYRAVVQEPEVRRSMVAELTRRLFAGDPAALVSHLLNERKLSPEDIERIARLAQETDDA